MLTEQRSLRSGRGRCDENAELEEEDSGGRPVDRRQEPTVAFLSYPPFRDMALTDGRLMEALIPALCDDAFR